MRELKNHQSKFCSGSGYDDMATLEQKLHSLKTNSKPQYDAMGMYKLDANLKQFEETDKANKVRALIDELGSKNDSMLRANIEKEQIAQAMNSNLPQYKKNELEKLGKQREEVRKQEANLMQNVAKFERNLFEQESYFKAAKDAALQGSPDIKDATLRDLDRKETEFVGSNTQKIREI